MIRALLFDLGNVLVHFSHERACEQMAALCGLSAERVRTVLFEGGLEWEYERGAISTAELHERFQRETGCRVDARELISAGCDIFWENPSMEPVIDQLKHDGQRLVLVSNTNPAHIAFVDERFPILRRFDRRVLSFEVGACKPAAEMFEAAVAAAGCAPEECFFTDDVLEHVEAARALGLDAVHYTTTEALVAALADRGIKL